MIRSKAMPMRHAFGEDERKAVIEVMDYYKNTGDDPTYGSVQEGTFAGAFAHAMGEGLTTPVDQGAGV